MKIHTRATLIHSNTSGLHEMTTTTEPPENAANVTASHVVVGEKLWQVVTWLELSPSERAEAMLQAHRRGGGIQ